MLFCKHNWKILSETTTESIVEQAIRMHYFVEGNDYKAFKKFLIQIVTCEKCGKLRRFVTEI